MAIEQLKTPKKIFNKNNIVFQHKNTDYIIELHLINFRKDN